MEIVLLLFLALRRLLRDAQIAFPAASCRELQCRRIEIESMKVLIPNPLLSYTNEREVEAIGATITELLADLDRQYPGLRFRVIDEQDKMRAHMRFFVNGEQVFDMTHSLRPTDAVQIVQALSGG